MSKELKNKFPDWCKFEKLENSKYDLLMTDDLDSWASCIVLKHLFGFKVKYFVDFNQYYMDSKGNKTECQQVYKVDEGIDNNLICVDFASESMCPGFDNHVTMLSSEDIPDKNKNSTNINDIYNITNVNYYDKFSGSTLIQIMSLYNIDVSKWIEEQKMVLCCIDGLYTAFDVWRWDFRPKQREYLKLLGYEELIELMEFHVARNRKRDFEVLKNKYRLDSKIEINIDGKLETDIELVELSDLFGIDLSLPTDGFGEFKRYDKIFRNLNKNPITEDEGLCTDNEKLFNFAVTGKDKIIYSKSKVS
ncbi:hypothetical protein ACJDU8_02415 [Clostridium sp. WILCCON 0269]|uniref:Uncharacterized protein n=1 Tax=Candidatus Clostridium eludens TaxID=3381663 RepID=A0ABW8SHT1_9CLOT